MALAIFATAGQREQASFAMGPLSIVPFGFPFSSLRTTAALSSNWMRVPSGRLNSFFWRTIIAKTTCFLISGFPFFTDARMRSPTPAAGDRPLTVLCPLTENILSTFAPELSQVSMYAPSGRLRVILPLIAFMGAPR